MSICWLLCISLCQYIAFRSYLEPISIETLPEISVVEPDGESVQPVSIPTLTIPPPEGAEQFSVPKLEVLKPSFSPNRVSPLPLYFCNPLDLATCTGVI